MCLHFSCSNTLCTCTLLQVQWSGKQLREAAIELQDSAQTEAQRRASQRYHLALVLPPHVLHILTLGKLNGKLSEWRAWRKLHYDLHCVHIHCFPKERYFMPASHIAPFSCRAINIISVFNALFGLAGTSLCISVFVHRWRGGVGSAVCLALRARVRTW